MVYLSNFTFSDKKVRNPNIYPYNIMSGKDIAPFTFDKITIIYGNNASGKSTFLNIIARKLKLKGAETLAAEESIPYHHYFSRFVKESSFSLGSQEDGTPIYKLPSDSLYLKSEDILYEVKKIQQNQILRESLLHDYALEGYTKKEYEEKLDSKEYQQLLGNIVFGQEKYSNGETSLQIFQNALHMDALYLLDEPEISLSPQSQVMLAEKINYHARFLGCQFIIATHSPFIMGTLNARIYNLDTPDCRVSTWTELENVRFFFDFFEQHKREIQ